jgi:AcrR family transcriptional regulator
VDIITEAALDMYGQSGDFTMADLAARLKVRQSSLYNHVTGKPDSLERIRHLLHEAMAIRVDVNAPWQRVVRDVAHSHRAALARHPWGIPMIAMSAAEVGSAITTVENFATVLKKAGFAYADVFSIIGMVDILTIGGSLDKVSPEEIYPRDVLDGPTDLARAARAVAAGPPRADAVFEFSLDLMIDALEVRLASRPKPKPRATVAPSTAGPKRLRR